MHDVLFEHQDALEDPNLVEYATAIGLDVAQFIDDMSEHRYAGRVREDFFSGVHSGLNGTPAFFINGRRYQGSVDLRSLLAAIENVIEQETLDDPRRFR
jgi:protein-disulfide isomerase